MVPTSTTREEGILAVSFGVTAAGVVVDQRLDEARATMQAPAGALCKSKRTLRPVSNSSGTTGRSPLSNPLVMVPPQGSGTDPSSGKQRTPHCRT